MSEFIMNPVKIIPTFLYLLTSIYHVATSSELTEMTKDTIVSRLTGYKHIVQNIFGDLLGFVHT